MARSYEATDLDRIELGDRVAAHLEQQAVDTQFMLVLQASGALAVAELVDAKQAA